MSLLKLDPKLISKIPGLNIVHFFARTPEEIKSNLCICLFQNSFNSNTIPISFSDICLKLSETEIIKDYHQTPVKIIKILINGIVTWTESKYFIKINYSRKNDDSNS